MTGGSGRDSTAWTMPVATRKQGGVHVAERNVEIAKGKTAGRTRPYRSSVCLLAIAMAQAILGVDGVLALELVAGLGADGFVGKPRHGRAL